MAGRIIAKLPFSWRDFATILKHKRQEISVENLIASLDVEEKSRAKDASEKGGEGNSSANMVQKNHSHSKNRKATHKTIKTTRAKRAYYTCVKEDTTQEIVLTVLIARQTRVMDQQDPRMST